MSVGKNAIKRVANDGYSNVKSSAPDMENSNVINNPDPQVTEKLVQPIEKSGAKKKSATKRTACKNPSAKQTQAARKNAFQRVSFGEEMPYYLL